MQSTEIPETIDDPIHFLLWSADEMAPPLIGLTVGVVVGSALILTALGFAVTYLYRRYRDNRPDGYTLHALYWTGLWPSRARTIPNPYARSYLP